MRTCYLREHLLSPYDKVNVEFSATTPYENS